MKERRGMGAITAPFRAVKRSAVMRRRDLNENSSSPLLLSFASI